MLRDKAGAEKVVWRYSIGTWRRDGEVVQEGEESEIVKLGEAHLQ